MTAIILSANSAVLELLPKGEALAVYVDGEEVFTINPQETEVVHELLWNHLERLPELMGV